MNKIWHDEAWEDYLYWQTQDKKTLKRINQLLKDIDRNGYDGIGKPEPLKYEYDHQGCWSRCPMNSILIWKMQFLPKSKRMDKSIQLKSLMVLTRSITN